ncbi:MAG: hypothetical protein LBP74_07060 [Treponema sp.]|nr:hypothetical protein [Treponema sp.]
MNRSFGIILWQISVALYLIANGVLGLQRYASGDYLIIYRTFFGRGDITDLLIIVTSIISLIAGVGILLELFHVELGFLDGMLLIVAIVWIAYIVVEILTWVSGKGDYSFRKTLFAVLQKLAVHLMVLGSLLTANRKLSR